VLAPAQEGGGSRPARGKARVGFFPFSFYSFLSILI
jgi:hypothetical protein